MSFFLHHLGHGQIAELLADPHQLVHDGFKLAQGLNLLAIERDQLRISQAPGNGLGPLLAREQRIGAMFDLGAVSAFDQQKLVGQRTAAQLRQPRELLEEGLALVLQVRIIRGSLFHLVVIILQ